MNKYIILGECNASMTLGHPACFQSNGDLFNLEKKNVL